MKLSAIKPGRWYETDLGIGRCVDAAPRHPPAVKFSIAHPVPRGLVFVQPRGVLRELTDEESRRFQTGIPIRGPGKLVRRGHDSWYVAPLGDDGSQLHTLPRGHGPFPSRELAFQALRELGYSVDAFESCQACAVHGEHDRCTGENTLGTKPCTCRARGHKP